MDSIYDSGNGQTPETAFVVISAGEEYFLLRINGLNVKKQAMLKSDDLNFDVIETEKVTTGEKGKYYFNIDFPVRWLNSQLGDKSQ